MTRQASAPEPAAGAAIDGILLRAATVGAFDPRKLVAVASLEESPKVLSELAERCNEVRTEAGMRWMLTPDVRRTVLKAAGPSRLREAAERTPPSDPFGEYLQEVLFGRAVNAREMDTPALDALLAARQFVEQAGITPERRSAEVNRAIARRDADAALRVVLPTPLVGRRRELAALRSFVENGYVDPPVPGMPGQREDSPPILAVTGVGGAGKSALLAELVAGLRSVDGVPGVPVILLDFDLPALSWADPLELIFALMRQIGHARPELDEALSAVRTQFRQKIASIESPEGTSFDAHASSQSGILSELYGIIAGSDLAHSPVVLVLDTFEEILVRGRLETHAVFNWLTSVWREAGLSGLRVIIAGRASPAELDFELAGRVLDTLILSDLRDEDAVEMLSADLARWGNSSAPVPRLVENFGGNPLVLRILAQFARANDPGELDALASGGGHSGGKLAGEVAQRFLYTRIIERIRDPEVRKLASLGLVLRRVTPELLREILAEPCGFADPNRIVWEDLFAKLRAQVWLVEDEGTRVRHRRDLRRLVLPQILSSSAEAALGIHREAVRYFSRDSVPGFTRPEREAERVYHEYSLPDHPSIDASNAGRLWLALGMDVEELPTPVRALLKHHTGRVCTPAERATLLPRLQEEQLRLDRRMQRFRGAEELIVHTDMADGGEFAEAGALDGSAPQELQRMPDIERVDAYIQTGRFSSVATQARAAYSGYVRGEWAGNARGASEQVVWYVFLAGLVHAPDEATIETLCEGARRRYLRPGSPGDVEGRLFTAAVLLATAAQRRSSRCREIAAEMLQGARAEPVYKITTFIGLRTASMIHAAGFGAVIPELEINGHLLPILSPAFFPEPDREIEPRWRAVRDALDSRKQLGNIAVAWSEFRQDAPRIGYLERHAAAYNAARFRLDARQMRAPESLAYVLRGTTPELHGLLRNALVVLASHSDTCQALVAELHEETVLWPRELLGEQLTANLRRDAQRWCATLVEQADQAGLLPTVIRFLREERGREFAESAHLFGAYERLLLAWPGIDSPSIEPSPWST
jgi:hypothetical protein